MALSPCDSFRETYCELIRYIFRTLGHRALERRQNASQWLPRAGAVSMLRMDLSPSHCPRHLAGAANLESSLLPGSDVPILYAKKKKKRSVCSAFANAAIFFICTKAA